MKIPVKPAGQIEVNTASESLQTLEFDEEAFHVLHYGKDSLFIKDSTSALPIASKTLKLPVVNNKVIKRGRKKGSKFFELEALHRDHQNSHHSHNLHFSKLTRTSKSKSIEKIRQIASDYFETEKIQENTCNPTCKANDVIGIKKIKTDEEWRAVFSIQGSFVALNRNECYEYEILQYLKETQQHGGVKQSNNLVISDVFSLADDF